MNNLSKKCGALLVAALLISLIAAMPMTAYAAASVSDLRAASDSKGITLTWNCNWETTDTIALRIEIWRMTGDGEWACIRELTPDARSWFDYSAEAGKTYTYRVHAWWTDGAGEYVSESNEVTASMIPPPPAGLAATAGINNITLSWIDDFDNESGFEIERSDSGGAWQLLKSVPPNTTSYIDEAAELGRNYGYRLRAFFRQGGAASSNIYSAYSDEIHSAIGNTFTVIYKHYNSQPDRIESVVAGSKAIEPLEPVKEGFVFVAWYQDAGFTTLYDFDEPVTTSITLHAKWTMATYAVKVNGGIGGGSFAVGAIVSISAGAAPPGMMFDMWTSDNVTFANPANESTSFIMPAEAVTVTATYKDFIETAGTDAGGGPAVWGSGDMDIAVILIIAAAAAAAGVIAFIITRKKKIS